MLHDGLLLLSRFLFFIHALAHLLDTEKLAGALIVGHFDCSLEGAKVTVNKPKQRKHCLEKFCWGLAAWCYDIIGWFSFISYKSSGGGKR